MNKTAKDLAKAGRGGDTIIAHLTPGEVVVPKPAAGMALGLLNDAGIDPKRYQVGHKNNSKNPRTGLLEFRAGDNDHGDGGDSDGGDGADGGGNDHNGNDAGLDAGRAMMEQNRSQLGWSRTDGETSPGTLDNMRDRMREGGYRGANISDTMSNMGLGYFDRAKRLGYGTALGTWGEKAFNTLGGLFGGMFAGPLGAMAGGTLGSAITGGIPEVGQQFSRNVMAGALSPALSGVLGPQLGSFASKQLASRAMDMATASAARGTPGFAQQPTAQHEGIGGLLNDNTRPMGQMQQPQAVAAAFQYTPGNVAAMQWNPIQWGTQYDPLRKA